ncbi:MAG: sigma 54-interacting transcriptional regulator [Immundisolibacter sp.]|uniref:sigma 54-interacting transcriptional regulator n=1 Tax=Immundisolibacter sp. TaxID=1934948 RepID=UPI003EE3AD29
MTPPPLLPKDITKLFRSMSDGSRVWMDGSRVLVIYSTIFTDLRRALIDGLGVESARQMLARIGYAAGSRDAKLHRRRHPSENIGRLLTTHSELQALSGFASKSEVKFEAALELGQFYCEFRWKDSLEAEAHASTYGIGTEPVCWILTGHASGYCTRIAGRPILFREVECRATGASQCRVVGKPLDEWGDEVGALSEYLRPQPFVNGFSKRGSDEGLEDVVGSSAAFFTALHLLRKVAPTKAAALILGETGVGKEVFARVLHRMSPRATLPFVAVNCAAIPESLMESELFGVERGAYTGAAESRPGRFERAQGGTLFLDEIGALSYAAQSKLLRALQEGEIERVGDRTTRKVDVRIVAATNVDLERAMRDGRFREDLYFRLNVFPIVIPPLRERPEDIPLLLDYFLTRFSRLHQRRITGVSERAVEALLLYDYPGNVRELEHMVERAVIMADDDTAIDLSHFASFGSQLSRRFAGPGVDGAVQIRAGVSDAAVAGLLDQGLDLQTLETKLLIEAVGRAGGNLARAARLLGISRPQLAYRLKKRGIADKNADPVLPETRP